MKTGLISGAGACGRRLAAALRQAPRLAPRGLSLGMIVGLPLLQLLLFGFAVNGDPRHLPLGVLHGELGPLSRSVLAALENTGYFQISARLESEDAARLALARGDLPFVLSIPSDFDRLALRGEAPALLLEADAADPLTVNNALAAASALAASFRPRELPPGAQTGDGRPWFALIVHRLYNPEGLTHYNMAPGLLGMILSLTLVMTVSVSLAREIEERARGPAAGGGEYGEEAPAAPRAALAALAAKSAPFILMGLLQAAVIMLAARFLFQAPFLGGAGLLYLAVLLFIAANVCAGVVMAALAKNQARALQMSIFYFLPNMLLSGFMFPFLGMPEWARAVGRLLPLTYFNRVARGVLLKGNSFVEVWPDLWPLAAFMALGIGAAALVCWKTRPQI